MHFLEKPFQLNKFLRKVRDYLDSLPGLIRNNES
jgi:hypothetical protein